VNLHPSRVLASVLLVAGGLVVAVSALAIALAKVLVDAGMTIRPADAALLGDLMAILPLVITFAAINLLAALGLLVGKDWADRLAFGTAALAVAFGAIGLILVVAGRDPFASTVSARTTADGIGIISAFTILYLAVIVTLEFARLPRRVSVGAAA
jgi:hypothetical protein